MKLDGLIMLLLAVNLLSKAPHLLGENTHAFSQQRQTMPDKYMMARMLENS